ncbi:PREDICTED: rho GTPase-activating protein 27-like [Charadrius vociferus]|uniref:rho GTPase-activating protein 27-like n=1 Tax=Charadrius vociferus TaxID=50402 RepID=UPI000521862C|nr:PREDICTED: rho GTPase-activating protein 27-like [Charadrius vociferus]
MRLLGPLTRPRGHPKGCWGHPGGAIPNIPTPRLTAPTANRGTRVTHPCPGSAPEEPGSSVSDWETHTDTDSGHLFYYNPVTGETTWDCPFGQAEDGVSPVASPASSLAHSPEFSEWEQHMDEASGQAFFYNSVTGETSWDPPHAGDSSSSQDMYPGVTRYGPMDQRPPTPETDYPDLSPDELEGYPEEDYSPVGSYDQGSALCLSLRRPEELGSPPGWYGHSHPEGAVFYPEHFASETFKNLEKAGVLNRTKTVDRGKRLRKNWSSSWTVLEGGILTFFKDSKHSAAGALRHPSTLTTPEHTVELRGATLTWAGKDKSSKKHVLEVSPVTAEGDRDQIFGCSLQALCERERGTVPRFVLQCIQTVERRGLDIDGLYRVSGNLATIQKLRYKVEHDEHLDLDDGRWEDIHVVTGALKLFFRELPEPLVPFSHFDKFIAAIKMQDPTRKGRCVRDLVFSLPPAHHDTMKVLFRHLSRVIEYKEENRMSVQSIAIVFGPTLLRPASEEGNMAMHMVFQNQVVEHILNQYGYIFPDG